ncbi:NUDIX hydrolase [Nocardia vulneris]|uniref:NUDIX hydrolase n=1 Tax=Nocardia vulneris TaxID=1141657 RepID=UPI00068E4158|nr:NUDIX domain-containing protein [Nocardia vulneris]
MRLLTSAARRDGIEQLSVAVVVRHDGKVLLLRRPVVDKAIEGEWEIPTGALDLSEDLSSAIITLVRTATCLRAGSITQVLTQLDGAASDLGTRQRLVAFVVDVAVPEPIEVIDHDAYTWTSLVAETPLVTETTQTVLGLYSRAHGIHARQRRGYHTTATTPGTEDKER